MTAVPPDPDPVEMPTVGSAHGVEPGETPPDSGSTSATANQDPPPRSRFTPAMVGGMVVVGVLIAIFLTVAVLYLLQVAGLMDRW
ncbi:hypothetical protein TUM20985_56620 [Mycobacterium antarcticum]|uniref:DUF6480 family protein n=1 Tax=unclassified Mycolicibacterium TaxID=2636767 RepID=UPI0023836C4E|nr:MULTISPECIES: DUF6480 family protein [unclassified Mycolicibacterium]BDX35115.1 hypothetical protein TUM20985_56620 [Mycolicibacterium sp. TUM20985]GLP78332.1 hypothetical protein TUM20983_54420 [Mycolicibacterium sp. TUM20983]GLP81382.1 hypothetical protein TUM20984_28020 [Mycolicibacterium sp. TUM20984]